MEEAHRTGSPLARPLWWHWPADPLAHDASGQWLLGDGVLVSPVLEQGADQVRLRVRVDSFGKDVHIQRIYTQWLNT